MTKKSTSNGAQQQGQSILSTNVMNEYLSSLMDKRKQDLTSEFGIDTDSADQILDSKNQRAFMTAVERFNQITPSRGAWFLCENTELFREIYREAITDWDLIDECLELGMAQMTIAELFSMRPRNLSMLTGKAISKSSNRTRMSDNTEILITSEVYKQIGESGSVFSSREFARLMIRISLMISSSGANDESSIAPIIVFIYNEQFPFQVVTEKFDWLDSESVAIDLAPKREKRKKQSNSDDDANPSDNATDKQSYLTDF
ncbi:hypothetical protein [Photobacterium leiognathi]|uniref:hypothetical protein n=1 Tax=Photobacterium leiognathi TaxID=553611 RepID=UPI0029812940|nr:hypothetical protein [Photobacterium leiognathi]